MSQVYNRHTSSGTNLVVVGSVRLVNYDALQGSAAPPGLVYCNCCRPMARAMGFILSPLRGWGVLRWLWTHGLRHGLYSIAAPRLGKRGLDWWWLDGGGFLTRAGVNAGV